jgi:hypothetical protein
MEILAKDKAAADKVSRVHFLMDFRAGKARYEEQTREAFLREQAAGRQAPGPLPPNLR